MNLSDLIERNFGEPLPIPLIISLSAQMINAVSFLQKDKQLAVRNLSLKSFRISNQNLLKLINLENSIEIDSS